MMKTYDVKINETEYQNKMEEVKIEDYIKQIISENSNHIDEKEE